MSPGRNFTMSPDQARERAEKSFKKEERARDGRAAMTEYRAGWSSGDDRI
jgi:hypothetical protein